VGEEGTHQRLGRGLVVSAQLGKGLSCFQLHSYPSPWRYTRSESVLDALFLGGIVRDQTRIAGQTTETSSGVPGNADQVAFRYFP